MGRNDDGLVPPRRECKRIHSDLLSVYETIGIGCGDGRKLKRVLRSSWAGVLWTPTVGESMHHVFCIRREIYFGTFERFCPL